VDGGKIELTIDIRLGGIDRRILIQYPSDRGLATTVMIGVARRSQFERMKDVFRKTFDSQKRN
jgi:hypothetical protein